MKIGPNKGEKIINEVVNLLEAYPLIEPSQLDLSDIEYDVLVIGDIYSQKMNS